MWSLNKTTSYSTSATVDNFLNWCVTLKDFTGNLGQFLLKRGLLRTFYTLSELLWIFKEIIRDDGNYDVNNPSIILADPELEKALGRRAIYVREMRSLLVDHVQLAEPGPNYRPTITFKSYQDVAIVGTPVHYLDKNGTLYKAYLFSQDLIRHANYNGPVTIEILKATMPYGFAISFGKQQNATLCSILCLKTTMKEYELNSFFELVEQIQTQAKNRTLAKNKSLTQALQAFQISSQALQTSSPQVQTSSLATNNATISIAENALPKNPSPKLLALLQSINGQATKKLFTYKETIKLIIQYILSKEEELFLPNCGHIAMVEDDPLGEIFQLKAFHRTQLGGLINQQLTLHNNKKASAEVEPEACLDVCDTKNTLQKEKGKCFGCKKTCNRSKIFCPSCWQIRRKKVGPQFRAYKLKKTQTDQNLRRSDSDETLCKICFQKDAKAGFLHGKIFHLFGCINCCREIYLATKPCPICRGEIDKVIIKYDS